MNATERLSIRCGVPRLLLTMSMMVCWVGASLSSARELENAPLGRQQWAIILVGLPGDQDHAVTFHQTADQIQKWLEGPLQFREDHILRLPEAAADQNGPAVNLTADGIQKLLEEMNTKFRAEDSLWIFTIGHGNYDGKRAWFHVQGRDPSSEDFGRWLAGVSCREQIIWLMHSSSGWFVKPLSQPGRIVIAATAADEEANETEFPYALATVLQREMADLDSNHDQAVSISELYSAVVSEVLRRFKSDNRLLTEHAQLDDNGDGLGTEEQPQSNSDDANQQAAKLANRKPDGELARRTIVPYRGTKTGDPLPPDPK